MRWIRLLNTVATLLLLPGLFPSDHDGLEPTAVEAGMVVISTAGAQATSCQYCIGITADDAMVFVDGNGEKTWLEVDSMRVGVDSVQVLAANDSVGHILDNLRAQIEVLRETIMTCREALPMCKPTESIPGLLLPF